MAAPVALAAITIAVGFSPPISHYPQILSPLTACACVVSFAILRRSLAAGAFASAISCVVCSQDRRDAWAAFWGGLRALWRERGRLAMVLGTRGHGF